MEERQGQSKDSMLTPHRTFTLSHPIQGKIEVDLRSMRRHFSTAVGQRVEERMVVESGSMTGRDGILHVDMGNTSPGDAQRLIDRARTDLRDRGRASECYGLRQTGRSSWVAMDVANRVLEGIPVLIIASHRWARMDLRTQFSSMFLPMLQEHHFSCDVEPSRMIVRRDGRIVLRLMTDDEYYRGVPIEFEPLYVVNHDSIEDAWIMYDHKVPHLTWDGAGGIDVLSRIPGPGRSPWREFLIREARTEGSPLGRIVTMGAEAWARIWAMPRSVDDGANGPAPVAAPEDV